MKAGAGGRVPGAEPDPVHAWLDAAERRYLADLTRGELGRALRALSSCYVERRGGLEEGAPLGTAGKRAAFAVFYGPLHFLTVRGVASQLSEDGQLTRPPHIVDLGCGTGAAGAAVALACGGRPTVEGYDISPWAVRESGFTYRALGVQGRARVSSVDRVRVPRRPALIVAAFVVNELSRGTQRAMLEWFLEAGARGHQVLLVEPIARRLLPWWAEWQGAWCGAGGSAREWRITVDLPPLLQDLDRATGLRHRDLKARTLILPARKQKGREASLPGP